MKLILAILLLVTVLPACSIGGIARKMDFKLTEITLNNVGKSGFDAVVGLDVTNPNWFDVTVISLKYRLFINGKETATGTMDKRVVVPANSTISAQLPVAVRLNGLDGLLGGLAGKGKGYTLEGEAVFDTFLGSYTKPFEIKK